MHTNYKSDPSANAYGIDITSNPSNEEKATIGRKIQLREIDKELQSGVQYPDNAGFQDKRNYTREHYDAVIRAEIKGKPKVYELLYEDQLKSGNSPILIGPKMIQAVRNGDLQVLADQADRLFASANTNDLIGSITLNAVGRGHSTEYYSETGDIYGRKGGEAFANLTDLHGINTPLSKALASHLAPNTYKFMKESLRGT